MFSRTVFMAGGILSALSVGLGAFGAHGLKDKIATEQLQVFETGVRYQFFHALALIVLGIFMDRFPSSPMRLTIQLLIAGIILFSGSLYLLSTRELLGIESWKKFLGPITPIGGLCFIAGWLSFCYTIWRNPLN